MLLRREELQILELAIERLEIGFAKLPQYAVDPSDLQNLKQVLLETAERLHDNYPYFHPLYAGQMLKPPHAVARLAYALAIWINPNNHALDGGKASSAMEKEAVAQLASLFDWTTHIGHLCGGGTMANLEALWIASQIVPDKKIVASQQAHYAHQRLSKVLKVEFESVPCDNKGRMDVLALKQLLKNGDVGTVVATMGTTATGSVDPLEELVALRQQHGFRLHADAAYGGYFKLANNVSRQTRRNFEALSQVDSVVIDPHKHGLQPYGCGCVLFRNPEDARFYKHESPSTYFSSEDLHLGQISLECSRPGSTAVALWATQKLLPLSKGGEFAAMISRCRGTALELYEKLRGDNRWMTSFTPELDIVVWAPRAPRASQVSELSREVFTRAARHNLHLALATLPVSFFQAANPGMERDAGTMVCLRSVLMKPEHEQWVERIWDLLQRAIA
jgi:tyrosine decarboxylase/aspartate 1-decarboxylase